MLAQRVLVRRCGALPPRTKVGSDASAAGRCWAAGGLVRYPKTKVRELDASAAGAGGAAGAGAWALCATSKVRI